MRFSHQVRRAGLVTFLCISANAVADCDTEKPIQRMLCHSASTQLHILLAKDQGLTGANYGREGMKQLDADIEPAVREAGKRQDLAKAVKDYYGAASTYFDNPAQRNQDELTSKEKALQLEMKLAGAKPAQKK